MTTSPQLDNPLLHELVTVHDMLRADLAACRELAAAALAGTPAVQLRRDLDELATRGPLFQLKANCLRWCQVVHDHHRREDATLFTAVRRSAPHLDALVDRLEDDHRLISDLLDEVEGVAERLDDDVTARGRLADALTAVSAQLLDHLHREEQILGPVFLTWGAWPAE